MKAFGIGIAVALLLAGCGVNPPRSNVGLATSSRTSSPTSNPAAQACRAGGAQSSTAPTRTPIPSQDAGLGIARDGHGAVWFAETNTGKLGCYRPGMPVEEVAVQSGSQVRTLRSAPDGSVWFAEPGVGALGHVAPDGTITEKHVAEPSSFSPNWGLAVGADGSVWYELGNSPTSTLERLRPDGSTADYPVPFSGGALTVDSQGNVWMPQSGLGLVRVSQAGQVTTFNLQGTSIGQVAEASDGRVWFLSVGCVDVQQIGWIDPTSGQTALFAAPNVDTPGFPNEIVRAPDGAVWFTTMDGRLVRLASATDVTVYSLPWPDAELGPFIVEQGNRIVMLGHNEVLDFTPVSPTRVAGPQAIPQPSPPAPKDAAEAAAYAIASAAGGPNAKIVLGQSFEGDNAALFGFSMNPGRCGYVLLVYVVEDAGTWHKYDMFGTQNLAPPSPGFTGKLQFRTGCLNVHESPTLSSKIVSCLPSGTEISIDGVPAYADGYLWWHVTSQGWAVQTYLWCTEYLYQTHSQC